jgi:hypothetical protein
LAASGSKGSLHVLLFGQLGQGQQIDCGSIYHHFQIKVS